GPIPHTELVRGTADGAVLYTDSTLALDADTGKIVWHHQFLPRDNWNLDHVFEQILVDINVGGRPRQALLAIGKPGIIWALDRRTPVGARNDPPDRVQQHRSRNRKGHHQREPDSHTAGAKPRGMSVVLRRQIVDGDSV